MVIIAGNSHPDLAALVGKELNIEVVYASTRKFADQELRVQLQGDFEDEEVVLFQSTCQPANDHLMELLLMAQTVKRMGTRHIIAVVPYFGYGRQDRPSYDHGPIAAQLVATLIETAGVSKVITVDLHSKQSEGFFTGGIRNLQVLSLFATHFQDTEDTVVVSPDVGGLPRARHLAALLKTDLAIINKTRNADGTSQVHELIGNVQNKHCILVDDIMDTGGTLCQAADLLRNQGGRCISGCVTHGVFSGACLQKIESAGFERFYVSNTVPNQKLPSCITLLSCHVMIADAVKRLLRQSNKTR